MTPLLELRGLRKSYGPVQALGGVDFDVVEGEVHALIGENGAGKSTVVKILAGLTQPDEGDILVAGQPVTFADRQDSAAAGVGVVHQHFSLVDTLTVAENLQLGRPGARWLTDLDQARADLTTWAERTGLGVHVNALVGELSVGERQRAEILSALAWGARLLLLDEPTAVLSPFEADALLDAVTALAADGLAVVLVTHKLREVEAAADRVTVLRAGKVSGRHVRGGFTAVELANEMIGDEPLPPEPHAGREPGDPRLVLSGVSSPRLHDVDVVVRAGEIVGVAGVAGNGQGDLVAIAAGMQAPATGTVTVDGVDLFADPRRAREVGLAYIPEDRAADGLALGLPVWTNAVAKRTHEIGGWRGVDKGRVAHLTERMIARLGVRPARHEVAVQHLSGGNQQRLVIGRELDHEPAVVVAAEPTRGLDPGSARAVLEALRAAADGGAAVLVVASDLDEVMMAADRVLVIYEGAIRLSVDRHEADRTVVGRAMVGA